MQITILIVDDVQANLISLRAILEEIEDDFLIIEASSGEEALEHVLNHQIDLVILDVQMPVMDGFEVAKYLKSNNLTKNIPILFITAAFKSDEFVQKGFELGAVDYLTKPINKHQLINRISLYSKLFIEMKSNRQKDRLMFQQSKMAAMGDMLATIAHQWRQPLSSICTCASGLNLRAEFTKLSEEELKEELNNIIKVTQYLSSTIDDFRTFFRTDKDKSDFNLSELIKKCLALVDVLFKESNIIIEPSLNDEIKLYTFENELVQVLLTILTNAKDVLDDIEENRLILVSTNIENNNIVIKIKDNGGGVPVDIIEKIFEPYFTTKHQSQGTGIGLYITNEIIVKHMHGDVKVKNVDFVHNNKNYIGAEFTVTIPMK